MEYKLVLAVISETSRNGLQSIAPPQPTFAVISGREIMQMFPLRRDD